jgi:hypothetical protein
MGDGQRSERTRQNEHQQVVEAPPQETELEAEADQIKKAHQAVGPARGQPEMQGVPTQPYVGHNTPDGLGGEAHDEQRAQNADPAR